MCGESLSSEQAAMIQKKGDEYVLYRRLKVNPENDPKPQEKQFVRLEGQPSIDPNDA